MICVKPAICVNLYKMKQLITIEKLKRIFPNVKGIQIALLYGSFGRKEGNPNSDIDIQILIDENFQTLNLIDVLKKEFENKIQYISEVGLRNKVVAYFNAQPKVEFGICKNIDEINRNYLGSEITNVDNTILFTNNNWKSRISSYLKEIIESHNAGKTTKNTEKIILELIDKFVYEFENCSTMHRRSDGFQFYFFYNIALHISVQLNHLAKAKRNIISYPNNLLQIHFLQKNKKCFMI